MMFQQRYRTTLMTGIFIMLVVVVLAVLPGLFNQKLLVKAHAAQINLSADNKQIQIAINRSNPTLKAAQSLVLYSATFTDNQNQGCFNLAKGTYTNLVDQYKDPVTYSIGYTKIAFDLSTGVCLHPGEECDPAQLDPGLCSSVVNSTGRLIKEFDFKKPSFVGTTVDRFIL